MKHRYEIRIGVEVVRMPNAPHGKAAETQLSTHSVAVSFAGEEGGRLGGYGDADHLGQFAGVGDEVARKAIHAAVAKAHEALTASWPETSAYDDGQQMLNPPAQVPLEIGAEVADDPGPDHGEGAPPPDPASPAGPPSDPEIAEDGER